jgi:hypothetical protein
MPEEISQIPTYKLNPNSTEPPKTSNSSKTRFFVFGLLAIILIIGVATLAYLWGKGTFNNQEKSDSTQNTISKSADLGKEFKANSGITIVLEEVKLDSNFEKEKDVYEQYLKKIATQSSQPNEEPEYLNQNKLDLKIAFKNKNKGSATYNPGFFRLKDSEDNQYEATFKGDPLAIYGVNSGETTRVHIYFTVPDSEKKFKLIYQNVTIEFTIS